MNPKTISKVRQSRSQADRAYDRTQAKLKKEAEDSLVSAAMRVLGTKTSKKKAASSRENGKLGGYPKGRPRTTPASKQVKG